MTNAEMERAVVVVGTVGADPQTPSSEPAAADSIVAQALLPPSRSPRRSGHFFKFSGGTFSVLFPVPHYVSSKLGLKGFLFFFFFRLLLRRLFFFS